MEEFYKKYGLHDACITHVSIKNSDVILHFEGGVYQLDENGKETSLTPACQLIIKCVDDNFDQHIIIERCYKRKKSEIGIEIYQKLMSENVFDIDIDYYSLFAKSILLKGYIGKDQINVIISDISGIEIIFL